ncbi:hypothetical protein AGABI2DRAFT_188799 [Agaricus bisporus var. bisporus H97]|uniref:hypothetical protein n=1 Tax=Agaricus bisporus var. bisporus (strain H97 / ATCC MYA-4626 / FGSC 10389) TaxID=936046 RepID=UPI00029F692A|nr:hypothetical protein AGABI2DRAFT_188799 [Agaricus bisporus var. bisporus H97]EKV42242.1 hypothetical protein AGABI2DRAFT_188799 [Agaricus bisporus var. bisporus H97]
MGPSEDYLKASLEVSTKAGLVGGAEDLDVDDRTVVRKLLVLDLNGTLVFRSPYRSPRERLHGRGSAEDDVYARFDPSQPRPLRAVHPRPYLSSFRQYLFHPKTRRWLDTMVWSSAQPHSVNDMVTRCFGDAKGGLVAIWARDKLGLNGIDYGRKVQTTKDLNKPWDELNLTSFDPSDVADLSPSSSSHTRKRTHSAKTTLLLDDSPLKAHLQPYNHLCLKEYDAEMRKHDAAVRELTLARIRLADTISEKKKVSEAVCDIESKDSDLNVDAATDKADEGGAEAIGTEEIQSSTHLVSQEHGEETSNRKRKRKAKKEDKKKERVEEMLRKLTDEKQDAGGVYDETLLAVVGILDAVKTESNIAAWIRAGGLIQSLNTSGKGLGMESSVSSQTSIDEAKRPRKKTKLSETVSSPPKHEELFEEHNGSVNRAPPTSVTSDQSSPPPTTSSPIHASSPPVLQNESDSSSETERTGVPLDDNIPTADKGKETEEKRLWFDHPGTIPYWASRGRTVLEGMGIEIDDGVVGPTG